MKRVLIVTVIALILAFVTVGLAQGYGGPHSGGYTATTDACAGCHRAHTATDPGLLMESSYGLCISCHGATAEGANTDVDNGIYLSTRDDDYGDYDEGATRTPDNADLLGGGFEYYQGAEVISFHSPYGIEDEAWGNGVPRGEKGVLDEALDCASCHDPHGSPNYRILNESINGVGVYVEPVDELAKDYDTEQWGEGTSAVCAACHGSYHVTWAGSGSDDAGEGTFAHRVDMSYDFNGLNDNPETIGLDGYFLPLAESGSGDLVVCMTCHLPHGSSSVMEGRADNIAGLPGETRYDENALLRLDNRGVCQVCHQVGRE